jgi:hypothetical protein
MPETGIPHIDSALISRTVASGMLGFFNFFTLFFPIYVLEELFGSTAAANRAEVILLASG